MSWKTWKNIVVMECHGNVMEFYFSGKVLEMSWNFTKMSWKTYLFTNSIIRRKKYVYFLNIYMKKIFAPSAQLYFLKSIEYIYKCFHLLGIVGN